MQVNFEKYSTIINQDLSTYFQAYPPVFEEILQKITRLKPVVDLLKGICIEGRISIEPEASIPSGEAGYYKHFIYFNPADIAKDQLSTENKITNLLFELNNMSKRKAFSKVCELAKNKQISLDSYVENIERLEYSTVQATDQIILAGIELGIFDPTFRLIFKIKNFDLHYAYQQVSGHSQYVAEQYMQFHPNERFEFQGTLNSFTKNDYEDLSRFIRAIMGFNWGTEEEKKRVQEILSPILKGLAEKNTPRSKAFLAFVLKYVNRPLDLR